jgi:hypothetical protein
MKIAYKKNCPLSLIHYIILNKYSCGQNKVGQCFFANVSLCEILLLWLLLKIFIVYYVFCVA